MKVLSGKALVKSKDLIVSGAGVYVDTGYVIDLLSTDKKKAERIIFTKEEIKAIVRAWNKDNLSKFNKGN